MKSSSLQKLYKARFDTECDRKVLEKRNAIWRILCDGFFKKFIPPHATIVDIGAGYCEFINNIESGGPNEGGRKIAVDLNPDTCHFAHAGVEVINADCMDIAELETGSCDIVFMSNFLEHLPTRDMILRLFSECRRLLKKDGRLLILQPNIRYVGMAYYDFFDHHTPLTEKSLVEALEISGFSIEACIPRFLPYTTKSRLPQAPWLVSLYLNLPLAWRILGKQCFISAIPL